MAQHLKIKMDERHWWIAGKIQESFHIGGFDNPTLLEDFLSEPDTLDMINQFFSAGGPCRLFVYCDKPDGSLGTISTRELQITGTLADLRELNLDNVSILYFLRHDIDTEVEASRIEKNIFCGDLKGNTLELMSSVLSEIYLPLMRNQKDWKQCQSDNQTLLMHNMEKVVSNLAESSSGSHSSKHVVWNMSKISLSIYKTWTQYN